MPGVYIDMDEHCIIDVDSGKPLAIIRETTMRSEADYCERGFMDGGRARILNHTRVFIKLELEALTQEFADGFQGRRYLEHRKMEQDSTKMIPELIGQSVPKLLTND